MSIVIVEGSALMHTELRGRPTEILYCSVQMNPEALCALTCVKQRREKADELAIRQAQMSPAEQTGCGHSESGHGLEPSPTTWSFPEAGDMDKEVCFFFFFWLTDSGPCTD